MKNILKNLTLAFGVIMMIASAASADDYARLQVIHNAADPAAATVDIYVNGTMYEDDFDFREATEFRTVPAGVQLNIGIAPGNSASAADAIATIPVTLERDRKYVAIASGVLGGGFADNPDGASISFNLYAYNKAREEARWSRYVDIVAFHGATDAPTVDIWKEGSKWWPVVDNLSYGEFSRYRTLYPKEYVLEVTPGNDRNTVVVAYDVDLSGLAGGAAVVFASGFLNPAANNDGPAFGLFAALPNGAVVAFPAVGMDQTARLQVIHNAADPAAATVDIYVNGAMYEDDFDFREATEFRTVPAGVQLDIGIAPGNSTSAADAIATIPVALEGDKTYVAIANGVLGGGFADNTDGASIGFNLFADDGIREQAQWSRYVDIIAFHGATDAPTVDVWQEGSTWWPVFNDLTYGEFSRYRTLATRNYVLEVTPGNDRNTVVATYDVDLSGLAGGAAVVFASGFLNPVANNDGPAFGLFAALPNGAVVGFPARVVEQTARLQVIHNAADPAAATVDIYVNDAMYEDDFDFREATEFRTVPAGVQLNIDVAPGSSTSSADALVTIPVTLEAGKTYVAMANGVIAGGFAPNPDGIDIGFSLFPTTEARESANYSFLTSLVAFHGATDAPAVDIIARKGWFRVKLFDDLAYTDFSSSKNVIALNYTLDVTLADNNNAVVASFGADLRSLGGGAAVVFASGFLSLTDNNSGEAFGLFAALPNGTVIALPSATPPSLASAGKTEVELPQDFSLAQNYPNPFNPTTTISFRLPQAADVRLDVFNILGQNVATLVDEMRSAGEHQVTFDAEAFSSGVYFYRLNAGPKTETRKMVLLK